MASETLPIFKLVKKYKRDLSIIFLTAVVVLFIYSSFHHECTYKRFLLQKKPYNFLNPPQIKLSEFAANPDYNLNFGLKRLSQIVQSQIEELQDSKNCEKGSILCGHFNNCGFGCQVHHRAACLMLSYAMGLPLIHETEMSGMTWAYSTPWTDVMLPLGSSCNFSSSTYNWTWKHTAEFYIKPQHNLDFAWKPEDAWNSDRLDFPLFDGIVVPNTLAEMVEKLHPEPFKWWASQFVQYVWKLQPQVIQKIRQDQASIGLRSDCIAFHIRRTDKKREANGTVHELEEYFSKAKEVGDEILNKGGKRPQIFIASDDATVLPESKEKYKDWDVVGFPSDKSLETQEERTPFLYEILRDSVTLAQCETIVCGLSSNICWLMLELHMNKEEASRPKLISLDGCYQYMVYAATLKSQLNKIGFRIETVL